MEVTSRNLAQEYLYLQSGNESYLHYRPDPSLVDGV